MNVDTDTQYAYLVGIRVSVASTEPLSRTNINSVFRISLKRRRATYRVKSGIPKVMINQTRKCVTNISAIFLLADHGFQYYDPRVWVREGEKTLSERVKVACSNLGNVSEYPFSSII
jgi:fructose/tagatose bisphosphate aldolase